MCNQQNTFILKYSSGSAFYVKLFCSQKGMQKTSFKKIFSQTRTVQKSVDKHHRFFVEQVSNQDIKLIVRCQILISNFFQPSYTTLFNESSDLHIHISCNHQNIFVLKYSIFTYSILLINRQNKNINYSLLLDKHFPKKCWQTSSIVRRVSFELRNESDR